MILKHSSKSCIKNAMEISIQILLGTWKLFGKVGWDLAFRIQKASLLSTYSNQENKNVEVEYPIYQSNWTTLLPISYTCHWNPERCCSDLSLRIFPQSAIGLLLHESHLKTDLDHFHSIFNKNIFWMNWSGIILFYIRKKLVLNHWILRCCRIMPIYLHLSSTFHVLPKKLRCRWFVDLSIGSKTNLRFGSLFFFISYLRLRMLKQAAFVLFY